MSRSMSRKGFLAGAAIAAVAAGTGLYAWAPMSVTTSGESVGAQAAAAGCTTAAIIDQDAPTYDGASQIWTIAGVTVTNGGDAGSCDSLPVTVKGYDGTGVEQVSGTSTMASDAAAITFTATNIENIDNWSVTIG